jgi:hypothetical protein
MATFSGIPYQQGAFEGFEQGSTGVNNLFRQLLEQAAIK